MLKSFKGYSQNGNGLHLTRHPSGSQERKVRWWIKQLLHLISQKAKRL